MRLISVLATLLVPDFSFAQTPSSTQPPGDYIIIADRSKEGDCKLEIPINTKHYDANLLKCVPNLCNCDYGIPKSDCYTHDKEVCESCHKKFQLKNNVCVKKICTRGWFFFEKRVNHRYHRWHRRATNATNSDANDAADATDADAADATDTDAADATDADVAHANAARQWRHETLTWDFDRFV